MVYPNCNEEKKLWKRGFNFVVGLDEAGRGPLAGPVVAAAVVLNKNVSIGDLKIRDSKKLSEQQREFFYEKLTHHKDIRWQIGIVSEKVIDQINILQATKLVMVKAIKNLPGDFLLIDGNFNIRSNIGQKSIIKGDEKVFSITAAGIIAKVTRDRIMKKMHKKYPKYGFGAHKGYGTSLHVRNLKIFGPCPIHRMTFAKVLPNLDSSDKMETV